jgi:integrase
MVRSIEPNLINEHIPLMNRRDGFRVLQFLNWNKGEMVSAKRILLYLQERRNAGLTLNTIKSDKNTIIRTIKKAVLSDKKYRGFVEELRSDLSDALPIRIHPSKVSESDLITMAEMKRIIRFAPPRWALISSFLWVTGCRVSDLIQIKVRDCKELDGNLMEVRVIGKGQKKRNIAIPKALFQQIRQTFGGIVFLFESNWNNQLTTSRVQKLIGKTGKKYLGRHIFPHLFRHTFITAQVKAGNDIAAIAEFVGNTPEIIARHYLHSSFDRTIITDYFEKLSA